MELDWILDGCRRFLFVFVGVIMALCVCRRMQAYS